MKKILFLLTLIGFVLSMPIVSYSKEKGVKIEKAADLQIKIW
jgi:hypothetical protein